MNDERGLGWRLGDAPLTRHLARGRFRDYKDRECPDDRVTQAV